MPDANLLPDQKEQEAIATSERPAQPKQQGGFPFEPPPPDLSWMKVPTERPPKPKFGPGGFTLRMADVGSYGYVPDHWPYQNDTPRGAWPAPGERRGLPAPYTIYEKREVWADNVADLYELAIQERWVPATEIAWTTIEPLPEHIELAFDQLCTNISEQQWTAVQVLSGWLKEISYGFHEVKLFLATQIFDEARHVEAFRKRALSNGGGLGVQEPGFLNRAIHAAFKFTELVIYINIVRASFLITLCEWGERLARSQADRQLFEYTARDLRRHLAYGIEHVKYYLHTHDESRSHIHIWLNRAEVMLAADLGRDKAMREALILLLGDTIQEGKARLKELRQAQFQRYLDTLRAATVYDREEKVLPVLREAIDNP